MAWLALSLELEAAAAEALSEAMLDAGALSVSIEDPQAERCRVSALLDAGADPAAFISSLFEHPPRYEVAKVEDADWVRKSQAQFTPVQIGDRLWIGPTWCEPPAARAAVVRLDPGMAFGTGSHPSTRLVLKFLENHVHGGERVLDYGCGSGILAIAAAKLGAARVDGVDVDPQALATAAANARANGVELGVFLPEDFSGAGYDLVVANILAQPLVVLAPLLAAKCAKGGRIALSGILGAQAGEVAEAYAPYFDCDASLAADGWALVEGARR